jgi:hypothetical protein
MMHAALSSKITVGSVCSLPISFRGLRITVTVTVTVYA